MLVRILEVYENNEHIGYTIVKNAFFPNLFETRYMMVYDRSYHSISNFKDENKYYSIMWFLKFKKGECLVTDYEKALEFVEKLRYLYRNTEKKLPVTSYKFKSKKWFWI